VLFPRWAAVRRCGDAGPGEGYGSAAAQLPPTQISRERAIPELFWTIFARKQMGLWKEVHA